MLHIINGDLLSSDCNVIIHQANCFTTMGAGIAKQIKSKYPSAYQADVDYKFPSGDERRLGRYSYAVVNGTVIVNLYSQYRYGRGEQHTDYHAMLEGLSRFFKVLKKKDKHFKVGVPFGMGCGLAGGHWPTVQALLEDVSDEYEIDIYIYKLG